MATATTTANPWGMKVGGEGGGGSYECCPAGSHAGTIIGLYHIGHQTETSQDKGTVEINRLILAIELMKKKKDGKPFVLTARYTMSMHKKANLYRDAMAILGRQFKEGENFNPLELGGKPVMVSVTNTGSGDKQYHNVATIGAFPEGFPPPSPTYSEQAWSVLQGDPFPADTDHLPYVYGKSIKEMAEASRELRRPGNDPLKPPATDPDASPF